MLGKDYSVGNFGLSGSTVSVNTEKPYVEQSAFQEAKDFQQSVVVIMLGTNDAHTYQSSSDFGTDYMIWSTNINPLRAIRKFCWWNRLPFMTMI
jgi:lysophospholipase L1-like esterase